MEVLAFMIVGSVLIVILKRMPAKGVTSRNIPDFVSKLFAGFKKEQGKINSNNNISLEADKKQKLLEKALESLKGNKLKEAENYYIEVLKIDQKDPESYKGLGQICFRNRDYKDALDIFQKLIELTPNDPSVYCNLGMCYFKEGDFKNALKSYKKALDFEKKPIYYKNMAITFCTLKKYEDALGYIEKALKTGSRDKGLIDLAIKLSSKVKNKKKVKDILGALLKLEPKNTDLKKSLSKLK